jgi:hypothetical protein
MDPGDRHKRELAYDNDRPAPPGPGIPGFIIIKICSTVPCIGGNSNPRTLHHRVYDTGRFSPGRLVAFFAAIILIFTARVFFNDIWHFFGEVPFHGKLISGFLRV